MLAFCVGVMGIYSGKVLVLEIVETEQHIHFTFHVYFDVIASQVQATPSAMATYNYSFQMYLSRAKFLKSMVFSVGMRRFKVRGVVYSYQTI